VVQKFEPDKVVVFSIASDVTEILNFPWEALLLPNGETIGIHPGYAVQRCIPSLATQTRFSFAASTPLRVLFMASAPDEFPSPPAKQEEEIFIKALHAMTPINLHVVTNRDRQSLIQAIRQWHPHVVHLAGPALIQGTMGFFAFEESTGQADVRSATEIAEEILCPSGAGLLVVSGREIGKPPPVAATGSLCQGIIASGRFPMAMTWPESLSSIESVPFLQTFYSQLATGFAVHHALTQARATIATIEGCLSWILAALYAQENKQPSFTRIYEEHTHETR
ncbi:MAG: CHAT domain-containing protein, partial [Magnetococcales bacterium]|nr:CHAT domain-containing protein [Magnetococcales bacterium]